jgi:hypothetical protein
LKPQAGGARPGSGRETTKKYRDPRENIETPARSVEAPEKSSAFFAKLSILKDWETESFGRGAENFSGTVEKLLASAEEFG